MKQSVFARRGRQGFTLIELLVVVVIIGILASVAVAKFADTRGQAIASGMRQDLKNLIPAAEGFYSVNETYDGFTAPVGSNGTTGTTPIAFIGNATGWSATINDAQARTPLTCTVGVGTGTPTGSQEGEVRCQ